LPRDWRYLQGDCRTAPDSLCEQWQLTHRSNFVFNESNGRVESIAGYVARRETPGILSKWEIDLPEERANSLRALIDGQRN